MREKVLYFPNRNTFHSYSNSIFSQNDKGPSPFPPTPYAPLTLTAIVLYYASICGSERIFQSMQFTYGLCGPLRLSPRDAVFTDKMYNIGFTVFR